MNAYGGTGGVSSSASGGGAAGIGGGGSWYASGGTGGNITINGGTVTAKGADSAAGIGGGGSRTGSTGAGAVLSISETAIVYAYSLGTGRPAIDAAGGTSTDGYYANASLNAPLSVTADMRVLVFPDGDTAPDDLFCILTIPRNYLCFGYTTNAGVPGNDNLYAVPTDDSIYPVVRVSDGSNMIYSVNDGSVLPVRLGTSYTITADVTLYGAGTPMSAVNISFAIGSYPLTRSTGIDGKYSILVPNGMMFTFASVTKTNYIVEESMPVSFTVDKDDTYAFTMRDLFGVDVIGSNIASWDPEEAYYDQDDLAVAITTDTGYHIIDIISVTMNSLPLAEGTDYTYADNTVTFSVPVSGDTVITADTAPDEYDVNVSGVRITSWSPPGTYHDQNDLAVTITPDAGYHIFAITSVTMGAATLTEGTGYTYADNTVTFPIDIKGNITINADIRPDEYAVNVTGSSIASWSPPGTYHGQSGLAVTITPDAGYYVSAITSVTMGSAALTEGADYTFAGNAVTFLAGADGDIVINADTELYTYDVTVTVISDIGGSFEYTVTLGGMTIDEDEFALGPGGARTINVPYGASVLITAISEDGHAIVWNDGTPQRSEGPTFARGSITENVNDLTVKFIPLEEKAEKPSLPWWWIAIPLIGLTVMIASSDGDGVPMRLRRKRGPRRRVKI
ncbi:MAG: hypothetical protein LBH69_03145 [Methanomassiliicoccaceae archaeon]|nr:hypothetical protein [Methanomassiliicoccaceae archaeon]